MGWFSVVYWFFYGLLFGELDEVVDDYDRRHCLDKEDLEG
jgi:hypothetical protein